MDYLTVMSLGLTMVVALLFILAGDE